MQVTYNFPYYKSNETCIVTVNYFKDFFVIAIINNPIPVCIITFYIFPSSMHNHQQLTIVLENKRH